MHWVRLHDALATNPNRAFDIEAPSFEARTDFRNGAAGGIRTPDPRFRRLVQRILCPEVGYRVSIEILSADVLCSSSMFERLHSISFPKRAVLSHFVASVGRTFPSLVDCQWKWFSDGHCVDKRRVFCAFSDTLGAIITKLGVVMRKRFSTMSRHIVETAATLLSGEKVLRSSCGGHCARGRRLASNPFIIILDRWVG